MNITDQSTDVTDVLDFTITSLFQLLCCFSEVVDQKGDPRYLNTSGRLITGGVAFGRVSDDQSPEHTMILDDVSCVLTPMCIIEQVLTYLKQ